MQKNGLLMVHHSELGMLQSHREREDPWVHRALWVGTRGKSSQKEHMAHFQLRLARMLEGKPVVTCHVTLSGPGEGLPLPLNSSKTGFPPRP